MTLEEKIQDLINCLDVDVDFWLIDLLNKKINQIESNINKPIISNRQYLMSKNGMSKMLKNYLTPLHKSHDRLCRINKILDIKHCNNCSFSIKKYDDRHDCYYKYMDNKKIECDTCMDRYYKICDLREKIEEKISKDVEMSISAVLTEDVISTRALITQVKNKIDRLINSNIN